jgi:type II restriction/modification system DNA methylase subunit YeeA
MNIAQIESNLQQLVKSFNEDTFVYDLLLAYGISKTSITRLKKGDFNLSKIEGEVLYKNKIFFKTAHSDKLLLEVEESAKDQRILKQNPRLIIVTDFKTIVAKDLKKKLNADFGFSELPKYKDFFYPISGGEIYKSSNDNKADRDAAYKLAQLYENLVTENPDIYKDGSHKLNVFLSRLLFCFFAEDTGIFEKESIFTDTLSKYTVENGSNVHEFLNRLFQRLNSREEGFPAYLAEEFPYVNGGLFRDNIHSPIFSGKSRKILLECGDLDWSEINPDIFGSMIQAVADPEERSDLGMHYTSVPNIKKLIEPLFLDELYEEYNRCYDNFNNLKKLINRIARMKFFDPACGSGNFLIIIYKEIRLLEIRIIQRLIDLERSEGRLTLFFTSVSLTQFYGIEIKDFAHEMAILSLWLAEHQMNKVFETELEGYGQSKPILPLKEAGRIVCDNAVRIDWDDVCPKIAGDEVYILGNPPYLGARLQNESQKSDMDLVFSQWNKYRDLDYISCWFYKAKNYIRGFNSKVAFVSTNSICQGQQVSLLWPHLLSEGIEIGFSYLSFKWTNNAKGNAGVTVIIVGLRNKSNEKKFLFIGSLKKSVNNINAYLIDYANIFIEERNSSISKFPKMNFGNMPNDGGGLIISEYERNDLLLKTPEAQKFIKLLLGSDEFLNGARRYCLWIENEDIDQAKKNSFINSRIEISRQHRLSSKDKGTNKLAERAHQFRDRNIPQESQLIIPRHSSEHRDYIPLNFLDANSIIADSAMAIYDAQPWLFGILHSKMHMVWVNAVGGKLETRYRYSAKLCYNTFPFPEINTKQKETISQYVYQVLDQRARHPEKTMAWLYNPETMPQGLKQAHKELDDSIERVYRLSLFQNDAERLEYLFKLYEEMTRKNTLFTKQKKIRTKK